jgi:uncharacterized phage-like protein YoqJ
MKIAFTGHRPDKLGSYDNSTNKHNSFIENLKVLFDSSNFKDPIIISGMALGIDTWAVEFAIKENIPFISYIPFEGQERLWPQESQEQYHDLLLKAIDIKIISKGSYASWKMQKRNKAMVDDCDLLIAVWDGSTGGTANCVSYAKSIKKQILYINPKDL